MAQNEQVTHWLTRLGQGDPDACDVIWREYFGKLVRFARRKLDGCRRCDGDEEDVALSAMHSFYRAAQQGRFEKLDDREDLWKLLVTITARKACSARRREMAAKRGGGKLRGESVFLRADGPHDPLGGIENVLSREPTPELADDVVENCRHLLDVLEDDTLRRIAVLRLEGYHIFEIAEQLGCVRRTVERKLERIRQKWLSRGVGIDGGGVR